MDPFVPAQAKGISKFVLVSSLLTNAKAIGQQDNPNYKFLNLFGGVRGVSCAIWEFLLYRSSCSSNTLERLLPAPGSETGS